jgi:predicted KAP-like P-loop ATPase
LVSGLAINWISGQFEPAAPVVIVATLAALGFLFYTNSRRAATPTRAVLKLGLISFLVGIVISSIWMIPFWPARRFEFGVFTWVFGEYGRGFWGYEWGAATVLAILSAIAVARRQAARDVAIFIVAASAGLSVTVAWISPHPHDVMVTIVVWALYLTTTTGLIAILPDVVGTMKSFVLGRAAAPSANDPGRRADRSTGEAADPDAAHPQTSHVSAGPGLLSDDARDGTDERPDELDRQGYADRLASLLGNVRIQSESTVLALIGDWGSGKSSVLAMLQQRLQDNDLWQVATFNPWTYPDTTSLHRGFFGELMHALPKDGRPGDARTKVGELARTISPLGKLGVLVGVDGQDLIKTAGDLIAGDTSASAAKRSAESALRAAGVPVLLVVDDLDRLTPDELLEVLKLVRLVGRLPHVYYLLSYDERTLLDVLRRTPVTGDNEERARAYMEKIVQVRLDMPALRATQRTKLLNDGLTKISAAVGLFLTDADERRLGDIYFEVLDRRLTTPRAIARFLGQIQAFYPVLHGEVDFVDFFLVNWLRTQEPGVYRMLQTERDELLGRSRSHFILSRDAAAQARRRERWDERLQAAHVREVDLPGVIKVLSVLFPEIEAAYSETQSYSESRERSTPKAISHIDYFDRYVSFGIPEEDVPDADITGAIADLTEDPQSLGTKRLREEITNETARTMRKLDALRDAQVSLPERELFTVITQSAPRINRQRNDLFDNPWLSAVRGAARCLATMDSAGAADLVTQLGGIEEFEEFVINTTWYLQPRDSHSGNSLLPAGYNFSVLAHAASAVLKRSREAQSASSPLDGGAMASFWAWKDLDPSAAKAWLVGQVDSGRWPLADTLGALTTTLVTIGVANPDPRIGDFDLEAVDEIFGLDRVFTELEAELDSATSLSDGYRRTPATPANRVQHALFQLKQARDSRAKRAPEVEG